MKRQLAYKFGKLLFPKIYDSVVYRPALRFLRERFEGAPLIGCEIGVWKGSNARKFFECLNLEKMFLIDPYLPYDDGSLEVKGCTLEDFLKIERNAKKLLGKWGKQAVWLRMSSFEAVTHVSNGLDFVYVDGNHNYEVVSKDLENYFPKLKKGGVLSGHDFACNYPGVVKAVLEFAEAKQLQLKGFNSDYWMIK